tara:strand:+ start:2987 stop:3586 length:600 start_codon:yes stop_codon:yes gene_type:complete
MKKSILVLVIFLFSIKNILANEKVDAYSFFYEEDGEGALILYYQNDDIFGQIISYGGYKWFKTTYTNSDNETSTFIQPSDLGISMNQDSWMQPRYEIDEFVYEFEEINNDQFLTFYSPEATQTIVGYMTRNESFSIASLSSVAWYAGTFIPIKNTNNLDDLIKLNIKTFCMLINDATIINVKSKQFKKEDLTVYREPCN